VTSKITHPASIPASNYAVSNVIRGKRLTADGLALRATSGLVGSFAELTTGSSYGSVPLTAGLASHSQSLWDCACSAERSSPKGERRILDFCCLPVGVP
jgi:hypothetical protein